MSAVLTALLKVVVGLRRRLKDPRFRGALSIKVRLRLKGPQFKESLRVVCLR